MHNWATIVLLILNRRRREIWRDRAKGSQTPIVLTLSEGKVRLSLRNPTRCGWLADPCCRLSMSVKVGGDPPPAIRVGYSCCLMRWWQE